MGTDAKFLNAPDPVVEAQRTASLALSLGLLKGHTTDVILSPYSLLSALAPLHLGAGASTREAMDTALGFADLGDDPQLALQGIREALLGRGQVEGAQGKDGEAFKLKVANAVWQDASLPAFQASWLDALKAHHDITPTEVVFAEPAAAGRINSWADEATEGLIPRVVEAGDVAAWKLAVTNATYLNAGFQTRFETAEEADYTDAAGAQVRKLLMRREGPFVHAFDEFTKVDLVSVPYSDPALSLTLAVPRSWMAVAELLGALSAPGKLAELFRMRSPKPVDLTLPTFKQASEADLKATLTELGAGELFEAPDFSAMLSAGSPALALSMVKQLATINTNETGTEAAAVTVGGAVAVSAVRPAPPVKVRADKPSLYFIVDEPTGQVLFAGILADVPSQPEPVAPTAGDVTAPSKPALPMRRAYQPTQF